MGLKCMQPPEESINVKQKCMDMSHIGVSQKCKNHSDDPIQQWCKETHESDNPKYQRMLPTKYQCMLPTEACSLGQVKFGGGNGKLLDPRAETQRPH